MDALGSTSSSAGDKLGFIRRRPLVVILAVALVLRLAVIPIIGLHHPDELWQYLEPGHELAFGRGVDAWEFRAGIRTWIIPVLIAPFMWLGDAIAPGSLLYIYLPKAALAVFSLTVVWSWWRLSLRLSRAHAVVAAVVAAMWFELVYFGARPLSEPISMALFFPAAVILTRKNPDQGQLLLAGFLLGLAFVVRFQLAPALLCLVLWTEWRRFRQTMPFIIAGGLAGLAMDGLIDFAMGEVPFRWLLENFRINLIEGKSSEFGERPSFYYLTFIAKRYSVALGPIFALAIVGAIRFPGLALVALVHLAAHSFVPHKELRFVLLSTEILIFLAAIGTADGINLIRSRRNLWGGVALGTWAAISLTLAILKGQLWIGAHELLKSLKVAGETPKVCGLATYELKEPLSAAYTYYHRPTLIFGFKGDDASFRSYQDRFNVVIAHPERPPSGGYSRGACHRFNATSPIYFCVYRRQGGCSTRPAPQHEINQFLARHGK